MVLKTLYFKVQMVLGHFY